MPFPEGALQNQWSLDTQSQSLSQSWVPKLDTKEMSQGQLPSLLHSPVSLLRLSPVWISGRLGILEYLEEIPVLSFLREGCWTYPHTQGAGHMESSSELPDLPSVSLQA